MSTLEEKIAVMQAHAKGKSIQCLYHADRVKSLWMDVPQPSWNWSSFDYRVKPEPEEIGILFNSRGHVLSVYRLTTPGKQENVPLDSDTASIWLNDVSDLANKTLRLREVVDE